MSKQKLEVSYSAGRLDMDIKEASTFLRGTLKENPQHSVCILGPPGVGKSEVIHQLADELFPLTEREAAQGKINFVDLRISTMTPFDILGIPTKSEDKSETAYLPPAMVPREGCSRFAKGGVLVLDEVTCAGPTMVNAAMQLVLDRRCGSAVLPKGWAVILAGNRAEDGADVSRLTKPMGNRCYHITIKPNAQVYLDYWLTLDGTNKEMRREILSYISFRPDSIFMLDADNEDLAFPSPRSWSMLSSLMKGYAKQNPGADVNTWKLAIRDQATATIGGAALEFRAYIDSYMQVSPAEIIDKGILPPELKKATENPALVYASTGSVAHYLTAKVGRKCKEEQVKNMFRYMDAISSDFKILFLQNLNLGKHAGLFKAIETFGGEKIHELVDYLKDVIE